MPAESVNSLNSDAVLATTDEKKILNTDLYKPNIRSEMDENMKNKAITSPAVSTDEEKHASTSSLDTDNESTVTLDENTDDSSIIDSDEDCEDVPSPKEIHAAATNGIMLVNDSKNGSDSNENDAPKLNIGSIAVQNSSGITFGNNTIYQGPVTIKQFLYDQNKWKAAEHGSDNPAFTSDIYADRLNNGIGNVSTYL